MYRAELFFFIILTLIILSSPFLPNNLLLLLDNVIIRITMIILLLYLISIGPTAGIFGLMALSILYLERNRRKVDIAIKKLDAMDVHRPNYATVKEASQPQKTVPVKPFDTPEQTEFDFLPADTCDSGNYEPIAPTINQKAVLTSIYPLNGNDSVSSSEALYEKLGFGHIQGIETVGESN